MLRVTGATIAVLLALLSSTEASCPAELFRITRSTNRNVVVYELGERAATARWPTVRASWILVENGGRRQDLNFLERSRAYGFDVVDGPDGLKVTLKADRWGEILVREHDGCLRAFRRIQGREALLERIHIEASGGLVPSVKWLDVFGTDPRTGEALREHIVP